MLFNTYTFWVFFAVVLPLYWFLVGSSVGAGVILLAITPLLKKLMGGRG